MSIFEKMEMWEQRVDYDDLLTNPSADLLEEYDLEESSIIDMLVYWKLIFKSLVYKWLIATLRRELYIFLAESDVMT